MLESKFQSDLIKDLQDLFPESIILKNDPNYIQGFPDILILYNNSWAALETKKRVNANRQPNQQYYIDKLNRMSYASFIYQGNKERILDELQQTFRVSGTTRLLKSK
jgi:hypothetical protein